MTALFTLPNESYAAAKTKAVKNNKGDYVVLLHGILRTSRSMANMAFFLEQQGFEPVNINYPSREYTLEILADKIHTQIQKKITQKKPIHFVGYSMGGLLVRTYLNKYAPEKLGRVVLLAVPNNGSEVADFLQDTWAFKKVFGPAGSQLITDQSNFGNLFGKVTYELGVIAGNSSRSPVSSIIIPGEDDGRVSVQSTKIEGMKDHLILPLGHTSFSRNDRVQKQTVIFLKHGYFDHGFW